MVCIDANGNKLMKVVIIDVCGEQIRKYLAVGENGKILSTDVKLEYDTKLNGHHVTYKFTNSFDKWVYVEKFLTKKIGGTTT